MHNGMTCFLALPWHKHSAKERRLGPVHTFEEDGPVKDAGCQSGRQLAGCAA